ncbi:anti-restriction SAMase [Escherichia phage mellemsur]|uniref:Anti-restriction SAMase n=1 Tax=Escherichia phage mellemsur TaxID=2696418 RepID=A0A6B9WNN8_9CAUD|nr:anti-restriction SAMase [Escherichia phage mellemsur]
MYRIYASAYRPNNAECVNLALHCKALRTVQDMFGVIPVTLTGKFDNQYELSMVFPVDGIYEIRQAVKLFCKALEQDCIMVVTKDDDAIFMDSPYPGKPAGKLVSKTGEQMEAGQHTAWTYDGELFWVVE